MDSLLPNQFHGSTTFNSKVKTYDYLAQRVRRTLGEPLIQIEVSSEQIYEFIDIAIEYFTKFAGEDEEYLVFRSDYYIKGTGLPIGKLFNTTPAMYNQETALYSSVSSLSAGYDYDMGDYRRVVDVFSFEQGNNTGVNTLFTIEQSLAQQMHFAYSLGSKAFDLITWHVLKDWLKTREKLFAMKQYIRFDPRTQVLRITPEPNLDLGKRYYGCVGVYLERPIKDLVKERWVMEYAKALIKISIANTRGKFGGTQLFGSGTIQYQELMSQGREEKKALEDELKGGFSEVQQPPMFFLG
jgi:hypothetical protein